MHWGNFLIIETVVILLVMLGLGFVRAPRFLMRKKLGSGFPWGYYRDQIPQGDPGFFQANRDFLHDTGTEFTGLDVYGDFGEFSGFGELGEYGSTFFADGGSSGGE